jgi:hypothetical protein
LASQYQFCFRQQNGSDVCTAPQGLTVNATTSEFPGASAIQLATLQLVQISTLKTGTIYAISSGTKATNILQMTGVVPSLPDDQWLQELIAWESRVWAGLQMGVVNYAKGYSDRDPTAAKFLKNNTSKAKKQLCQSQRMRMSGGFV